MTDSLVQVVVVPYSRFLECQDRRRRITAELTRRDEPPTTDADAMPVPVDIPSAQTPKANNVERS